MTKADLVQEISKQTGIDRNEVQYCPSYVSRETGPSIGDINFANSQQLPGILYDYEDAKIYGGDSKDKKYKMQTFGEYAQRPDRIY